MPRLIDADALMESIGCADAVKYGNRDRAQQDISYRTMMLYEIRDEIDAQPTVGGWISVKDRLPEENVDCIFCIEWTGLSGNKYREIRIGSMKDLLMDMVEPIAWMPLPEPPEEVTGDE